MENDFSQKFKKFFTRKMKIRISIIALIFLISFGILFNFTIYYDKLYHGISVNGIYVGGSTKQEAKEILSEYYRDLDSAIIEVECKDQKIVISGKEIVAKFDVDKCVEKAFNYGKEGNIFNRVKNGLKYQFTDENITYNITYDRLAFDSKIDKLINSVGREVVQPTYSRVDGKLYITTGITGIKIDEPTVAAQVVDKFNKCKNDLIICQATEIKPNPVNVSKIRNEIYTEAQDATYINTSGAFEVTAEKTGIDFDIESAEKIANAVTEEGVQFTIDLVITLPQVTTAQILKDLFKEELSSFTSYYKVSEVQRTENVRLSAEFINGIILMPGQEFSYSKSISKW